MTDAADAADAASVDGLAARLDDLIREVRRQGRAAVAAQAAAEACLEKLTDHIAEGERELAASSAALADDDERSEDDAASSAALDDAWAHALLPVADAVDRVLSQANAMAERRRPAGVPAPTGGLLRSLFGYAKSDPVDSAREPELVALAEGLRVLRAQLATALETCGVRADRRLGVPLDPEVHRVVEVRAPRCGEEYGVILEVIRPGYAARGRLLREAEVVASAPRKATPRD
jgi:molecular chaperone GrpE (heat shock protein)